MNKFFIFCMSRFQSRIFLEKQVALKIVKKYTYDKHVNVFLRTT